MSIPANIKEQFPLLSRKVHGKPIVYLDSAASSQKPDAVLSAMDTYYRQVNANVHRGAYEIAAEATEQMETARSDIAKFINAYSSNEIIFTKNATEAFNLVARSWGARNLGPDDAILITDMEHHANIVPWQILAEGLGFEIRWIPLGDDGTLDLTNLDELLEGVKLCSVTAMSNVLGTLNPIRKISDAAHAAGALMLMDGSQYVPHLPTDVADLDVDFMCFTGHKMCGPTGIGVLWARAEILDAMPPFLGGGEMILDVKKSGFVANEIPHKFEAGTPPIAEIIGLGAAVRFLDSLGMKNIREHEISLTKYAFMKLKECHGGDIQIHGPSEISKRG
ncbi:MAG: aminotransferase class V-fold PLP-dependent enzyme, partial [Actinomycetota bacterium]|nr:aminotransferase class V-fold PLP-dependent enzyme [Actinomycetota bacterium]